jgi:hypothetical protein
MVYDSEIEHSLRFMVINLQLAKLKINTRKDQIISKSLKYMVEKNSRRVVNIEHIIRIKTKQKIRGTFQ